MNQVKPDRSKKRKLKQSVVRIAMSKNLNHGKLKQLTQMARLLGKVRTEVWDRFGSVAGVEVKSREVRDSWVASKKTFNVLSRLWKATLASVFEDIKASREAAKFKVRKAIRRRTRDELELKRLYSLLKYDLWLNDPYLSRMMRRYSRRGHTKVKNQIVLDSGCYDWQLNQKTGQGWLCVMGLKKRSRVKIPLNNPHPISGTIRLIIRDGRIEVHHTVDGTLESKSTQCGNRTIGIDKGYTEAFTDSDGEHHGRELGYFLTNESDYLKQKYQRRNKLRAIAQKKPHKRRKIERNNLRRKKLDRRYHRHYSHIRDIIAKGTHKLCDKASTIACEDLTVPMKSRRKRGKDTNRRLSGWVKGLMADCLSQISQRRGSSIESVNPAYTSQMDSRNGCLIGRRVGDWFYCVDGVVIQADVNAAKNILARLEDEEIQTWTPYRKVKDILLQRTRERFGTDRT